MNNTTDRHPLCLLLLLEINPHVRNLVTVLHACLVLLIVGANSVLIFGIIKTKRNKFTSSQILFLTLFSYDLTFGVVQIPVETHLLWKKHSNSDNVVGSFSIIYQTCISGTILSAIGIDRYIRVVHYKYYKRIITNKSLTVTITLTILIPIVFAIVVVRELMQSKIFFIAMSTYTGAVLAVVIVLNVALLKHVTKKTKGTSVPQRINSSLTKTVTLILASMVVAYLPLMINLTIIPFLSIHSTKNKESISTACHTLFWTLIQPQINAVLNSVIYFSRNSRVKHYFYKLLISGNESRPLTKPTSNVWYLTFD